MMVFGDLRCLLHSSYAGPNRRRRRHAITMTVYLLGNAPTPGLATEYVCCVDADHTFSEKPRILLPSVE